MTAGGNYSNNIGRNFGSNIGKIGTAGRQEIRKQEITSGDNAFGKIFQQKLESNEGLRFSKHAEMRLQSRNINLSQVQRDKMNAAVKKAEAKGVKDSLVLLDDMAFVVNIRSKTVITAANSSELRENVFTNIDGAVIA